MHRICDDFDFALYFKILRIRRIIENILHVGNDFSVIALRPLNMEFTFRRATGFPKFNSKNNFVLPKGSNGRFD